MTKETPELLTECWQLLVDYIPRKDQSSAAEQLFSYLSSVLSKEEQEAIADLDGDLGEAYAAISEEDSGFEEEEDNFNNEYED
jgi:hypothetical protein